MTKIQNYTVYFVFFTGLFLLTQCSTQRNNFVNRNLHQLSTKYNVLFNGEEALNEELQNIHDSYQDNFFEILPVEQFNAEYTINLSGQKTTNDKLDRAEEKAVKAIQKHSMEIHGVQENNQIDKAYLLLGKSRYYQKRFMAALDAFNYELDNDFKSDIRPLFKLWKEKTNIRMENNAPAIRNLKFLARQKNTPQEVRSEAYAYAGQALINMDSLDLAAQNLEKAAELAKDKEKKARYKFIVAQLLDRLNLRDSAVSYLQQIEIQKRPRKYSLQAELYRYHLSLDDTMQHQAMLDALYTKLKRYEYHKFYPYINYEIGEIFHYKDSLQKAVDYYTKAARGQDQKLKEKAYEQMSKIGFQKKDYLMAGAYLDSLLQVMPKETLKYLKTTHKRRNIEDIIVLEKMIKRNDSIMKLVNADSLTRVKMIQAYIDRLRQKEAEAANRQNALTDFSTVTPKYTSFYFYNNSLVEKGKAYFNKTWGKMSLADMWRLKNKMSIDETEDVDNEDVEENTTDQEATLPDKYKISYYYKQIPAEPKKIDSILSDLNYAHYQAGMIYFEKFKELEKAQEHLETMLSGKPKKELVPPAKYNLYKIYKLLGDNLMAEHLSQEILDKYPESIYAELIKNPDKISEHSNKAFQKAYDTLYQLYTAQQYDRLLKLSDPMLVKFSFHPELGKIELLRATAIARSQGLDAYEKTLKNIILKYPKSPYEVEAKKRMELVNKYKRKVYTNAKSNAYKLVIPFDIFSPSADTFIDCINRIITENKSTHLKISKDPFTAHQSFIVVHNFLSAESAEYLADLLKKSACAPQNYFVISSDNYKTLQLTKKLKAYLDFVQQQNKNQIRNNKDSDNKQTKH